MPDNMESYIIKLEVLEKEYMVILKQYEENFNNYITNLKVNKDTEFVSLRGRVYWGKNKLKESTLQTIKECESMCASDLKCTGATFNSSKRYCWTREGEGNLNSGTSDDYAIIPKLRENLIVLKTLNQKLIDINNEINTTLNKMYPIAQEDIKLKNQKQEKLKQYYGVLLNEQIQIEKSLKEYETIEQQYDNNFLNTVSQNVSLRVWTVISLIILVITIKQLSGSKSINSALFFWVVIIVLLLFLSLNLTTAQGFSVWGLLIVIIIFIQFKIIPSP
jgi:Mg2+ and Co2+ transporter CorA